LKVLKKLGLMQKPKDNFVTFKDHSNDFPESDSTRKRKGPSVDLPDPLYIAIHAAVAEVLNMSGAGRFFDELLDNYKDDEGNVRPVRSWSELETLMNEKLMRESVTEAFHSVKVR
jgi:hypothetical protein